MCRRVVRAQATEKRGRSSLTRPPVSSGSVCCPFSRWTPLVTGGSLSASRGDRCHEEEGLPDAEPKRASSQAAPCSCRDLWRRRRESPRRRVTRVSVRTYRRCLGVWIWTPPMRFRSASPVFKKSSGFLAFVPRGRAAGPLLGAAGLPRGSLPDPRKLSHLAPPAPHLLPCCSDSKPPDSLPGGAIWRGRGGAATPTPGAQPSVCSAAGGVGL